MKVVALNGSPAMSQGNTAMILTPFLDGMRSAGAEVESFNIKRLNINPCQGEFNCWLKTPGQCFQQDDMQMLLPKLAASDVLVLATPVYVDGITGPMKNLLDRLIPLAEPFFELRDGHCRHPVREGTSSAKLVLVSNCGFWELDNFDPLLVHMQAVCKNMGAEFAGDIHCVFGNGDGDRFAIANVARSQYPNLKLHGEYAELEFDGVKVAVTHYPFYARALARTGDYRAVFSGHTHEQHEERLGETLWVNPGEVLGWKGRASCALYDPGANLVEFIWL